MPEGKMEGTLWKWTNYFSGWQPRWFVLENGILSYYRSQDDVINGCKGSIKMAVCDVNVHGTDMSRLDLIIPGEAHFYVKAATAQERQHWLVALGSSKACLTNGKPTQTSNMTVEIPEEQLKVKKSELRLYCDLLMQQVHSVKSAVQSPETPSVPKLNEATSLLAATCDTFINSLEDCMKLASAQPTFDPSMSPDALSASSPSKKSPSTKTVPWSAGELQRSISVDRYISPTLKSHRGHKSRSGSRSQSETSESSSSDTAQQKEARPRSPLQEEQTVSSSAPPRPSSAPHRSSSAPPVETLPTFLSTMSHSFKDIEMEEDRGIPTAAFLDACTPLLPIFDKLNPTAFAPVKLDLAGNIKKIQQKFSTDPEKFQTLQRIIEYEVKNRQHLNPNCATVALLWLKRSLEFTREFLTEYVSGVDDLKVAANTAYAKTLKQYHSWVVRGVFALTVKAVPSREEFLQHLALDEAHVSNDSFHQNVVYDMNRYILDLDRHLEVLREYYSKHDLDSDEQV